MRRLIVVVGIAIQLLGFYSCTESKDYVVPVQPPVEEETDPVVIPDVSLKEVYKDYFPMGCAISTEIITNASTQNLLVKHYSSITAENCMKFESIQPNENSFNWKDADATVNFAVSKGLLVRGHTLVWHNQTPSWVFKDGANQASKELLYERMEKHIRTTMEHFGNKVYCWDVVNEAISDGSETYRTESGWYKIAGEEYIQKAFEYANAVNPNIKLFYNDYNLTIPAKRDKVYNMIKGLLDKGVKIDGIGMQGHYTIGHPSEADFAAAIDKFASLGVKVQITELDVSVYTSNSQTEITYTDDIDKQLSAKYEMIFRVLRDKKDKISGVSFWGLTDAYSWLNNFPVQNRKDYPLLFDRNLKTKKPFINVVQF